MGVNWTVFFKRCIFQCCKRRTQEPHHIARNLGLPELFSIGTEVAPAFASFNRGAEIGIVSKSLTYSICDDVHFHMTFSQFMFQMCRSSYFFSWIFGPTIKIVDNFETHSENTLDSAVEEWIRSPCAVSCKSRDFNCYQSNKTRKSDPCDDQICCWVSGLLEKNHQGWWLKSPTTKTTATATPGKLTAFRYLFFFKFTWDMCSSVACWRVTNWYCRLTSTYL